MYISLCFYTTYINLYSIEKQVHCLKLFCLRIVKYLRPGRICTFTNFGHVTVTAIKLKYWIHTKLRHGDWKMSSKNEIISYSPVRSRLLNQVGPSYFWVQPKHFVSPYESAECIFSLTAKSAQTLTRNGVIFSLCRKLSPF